MGRTPLQSAIKRNLLGVTTELLAHGADPMVRSESSKVAKDFVRSGPDREKFLELLGAKTNVEATNADATPASFRKSVSSAVRADLSSIGGAIQAKHKEAVATILRVSLKEDVLEEMLSKRQSIELGIKNTSDELWRFTLTQIGDEFEKKLLTQVIQCSNVKRLQDLVDSIDKPDWIHKLRLDDGWTALHLAASLDSLALVRCLLVTCGMDPLTVSVNDKLALHVALEGGGSNEMCWMLLQHMKKRAFSDRTTLLLSADAMTLEGLRQLLGHMTSVYDLRLVLSLGFKAFSPSEMHAVLIEAFQEVIREKLVLDDHAAVFFKVGLQECRRQELISEAELIEWDLKTTKVNVENSEWVREIKHTLQEVECRATTAERNIGLLHAHINALRDALVQNQEYETKRRTRDRLLSLVSSALVLCGGLVIKDVVGAIFDIWDPAKLLGTDEHEFGQDGRLPG